jgi:hypothetical protein
MPSKQVLQKVMKHTRISMHTDAYKIKLITHYAVHFWTEDEKHITHYIKDTDKRVRNEELMRNV